MTIKAKEDAIAPISGPTCSFTNYDSPIILINCGFVLYCIIDSCKQINKKYIFYYKIIIFNSLPKLDKKLNFALFKHVLKSRNSNKTFKKPTYVISYIQNMHNIQMLYHTFKIHIT